jgi:AP-2 complex subunit mu-1
MCRIPRVQGGQELTFNGTAQLTSTTTRQVWARPPIDVDFQVLMFTSSGLIVRFLKVFEKSSYHSIKWVRYLTKASGTYQIRVGRHGFLGNLALTLATLLYLHHSFSGLW